MEDKPKKRNWLAVHAKQRKAGAHTSNKYTRKTKHKGKDDGTD